MRVPPLQLCAALALLWSTGCAGDAFQVGDGMGGNPATGGSSNGGTGGGAATGGSGGGGTGGATSSSGGATGTDCPTGRLEIEIAPVEPGSHCLPGCGSDWFIIKDPLGRQLDLNPGCGVDCGTCNPVPCPAAACAPPMPLVQPRTHIWDGTYFGEATCGAETSCTRPECAPSGRYTVEFCVFPSADDSLTCPDTAEQTCGSRTFEWPLTGKLTIEISPG